MSYSVRLAGAKDIPVIVSLADTIWREYYPAIITREQIEYMLDKMYAPERLAEQMTRENHDFYLIELDGLPVGYLSIQETDPASREFFLHKFYILARHRGRGTGGLLFERILRDLAARGAGRVKLCVNRCNVKAINFYFKTGFTIESAVDTDIGGGFFMNDFVMVKRFG